MQTHPKHSLAKRLKTLILGGAHNPSDSTLFHRLSLIAVFAWIGLGADALSSSSYGPEAAFLALGHHTALAVFVAVGIIITIFVITTSYSQIVELFPGGGGGYLVASRLLSPRFGMLSGCALLIDYVLTIALSIASGADAIFSFLPAELHTFKLNFAILILLGLIIMNLRGVKESVVPLIPIVFLFMATHIFAIAYTAYTHALGFPVVLANTAVEVTKTGAELGFVGMLLLILRGYSMGAGTYTGIEAVSNAMPILREPKVKTAKRTMHYMALSLAFMVIGLMFAYLLYEVKPETGKTLNAVLFENITSNWGEWGYYFVLVTLLSEAALLFVAAQTGFLDGPRVLANMALDHWVPKKFSMLSDRFVTQNGVFIMGLAALALVLISKGSVTFLIVLYSIAVFITFLLSQAGMVRYWWKSRKVGERWRKGLLINGVGVVLTAFILLSMVFVKFSQGGWITLLIIAALAGLVTLIKRHYTQTSELVRRLDTLIPLASSPNSGTAMGIIKNGSHGQFDPHAKTAVLLVNGFNGLGLKALSSIFRLFGDTFKNFVFIEVGVIDAGVFKGADELKALQAEAKQEANKYVEFMKSNGYHAESMAPIATDVVDEVAKIAPKIIESFPNAVFFGGQIVFPNDTIISRWLHNYTVFASQRELYSQGIPFLILPVKV